MSKTIAVNAGSSTLKFKLFDMPSEEVVAEGTIERIGEKMGHAKIKYGNGQKHEEDKPFVDHAAAVNYLLDKLIELKIVASYDEITAVGHRIVAGGEFLRIQQLLMMMLLARLMNCQNMLHSMSRQNWLVLKLSVKYCLMHLRLLFLIHHSMLICQK